MKRLTSAVLSVGISLVLPLAAGAEQLPFSEAPAQSSVRKQSVRFLFPEQVTIAANKSTAVELHFKVMDGMHVNSHIPREPELIPTNLVMPEMEGIKISTIDFPAGEDYSLAAEPTRKLSVYSGEFVLKMKIEARPGDHLLQGGLRYQACDTNACYPPRSIPVVLDLQAK